MLPWIELHVLLTHTSTGAEQCNHETTIVCTDSIKVTAYVHMIIAAAACNEK